jgi:(R,R)-butanediol dehydrogenase / meso-butanediol dehydrogenase / diacetyl reductase
MRAARYTGIRDIRIAEVDEPVVTPDGIVIEIRSCGICGSDLHAYTSGMNVGAGQVMGHEFAGDVVALGENVRGIAIGDRVSAMPLLPCWECSACRAGEVQRCINAFDPGIGYGLPGAFASRVHIPNALPGTTVFTLPDGVSYEEGATIEPLAVAVHAVHRSAVTPNDVAVVIGLGPIGQLVGRVLLSTGLETVVGIELSAERRRCAEQAGMRVADGRIGLREAVLQALGQDTGVTAVFECSGVPTFPDEATHLIDKGGSVTIVAIFEQPALIDISKVPMHEVTIRNILAYRCEDFAKALELVRAGAVNSLELVTRQVQLSDITPAFEELVGGGAAIKTLVSPAD